MHNNKNIEGFVLESVDSLSEFLSEGRLYRHLKTGCEIYHVSNNDRENLFSFIFKTVPEDSSGIAHIIEHSVLSGSKNFPLKDPFIQLLKSSMYTFLNAMTYPDKTVYPASSTVEKDYFNLMEVYGDAVFLPLLEKSVFLQEGIRFEKKDTGEYYCSGVVYNEMKGNYSDHNSVLAEWSFRSLFSDSCYKYDSGGDPAEIKNLTYNKFLDFHKNNYHPSNCRIFLYGNIPSEKQLRFLDEKFLSKFSYSKSDNIIPLEKKRDQTVYLEKYSHSDDGKGTTSITINWLCGNASDPAEAVEMEILSEILLGTPGSPLYLAVIKSGLGEDLAPVSGVDTDIKQILFSVGIRGTKAENVAGFETLIESTLKNLAANGIDRDLIEGTFRIFEFSHREIKGGRPLGLKLMDMCVHGWLHDEKPARTLCFAEIIKNLREKLEKNSRYFESLIEKNFLKNTHRSVVTVQPAEESSSSFSDEIKLDEKQMGEAENDYQIFIKKQKSADTEENIRKIPILTREEIPEEIETISFKENNDKGAGCLLHSFYTAGITYTDIFIDIIPMDEDLKDYLPIFSRILRETGLPGIPYYDTAKLLNLKTGGFYVSPETGKRLDGTISEFLVTRFKALSERYEEAADFIFKLIREADFDDTARLKDIVREMLNDYKAHFLRSGNYIASITASSRFSMSLTRQEKWAGVSQFYFLQSIDLENDNAVNKFAEKLKKIRNYLISTPDVIAGITSDEKDLPAAYSALEKHLPSGKGKISSYYEYNGADSNAADTEKNDLSSGISTYSCVIVPSMINFNSAVIKGSRSGTDLYVYEKLLSRIIETGFLWEKVRMEGGAYGVASVSNGMDGVFTFSSYRDPRIAETQKAFRDSLNFVSKGRITEDDLFKAVLSGVGREIRPLAPGEKGVVSLRRKLYGIDDAYRQHSRNILLGAGLKDIEESSKRLESSFDKASRCVVAGKDSLEKYKEYLSAFQCRELRIQL